MRIAVTGSSGRLGSSVVQALSAHGHSVIEIDRTSHQGAVDLCDVGALATAMRGAETVCHLGGYPAFVESGTSAGFANNTHATYNVFEAAERVGVHQIVYASSVQVYGFSGQPGFAGQMNVTAPDYLPVNERHPLRPANAYPLSKMVGEKIADSFVRRNAELCVWSLRFTWIPTPELLKEARADHAAIPPIASLWSYVSLEDAACAVRLACERYLPGHTAVNIASAQSVFPWSESEIETLLGTAPRFARPVDRAASLIDTTAARALLGFIPSE